MEFEWDETKNRANLDKHGIAFEEALEAFDDPRQLNEPARTVGEARLLTIGWAGSAVLSIVHTLRWSDEGHAVVRVISARPASRRERRNYGRR